MGWICLPIAVALMAGAYFLASNYVGSSAAKNFDSDKGESSQRTPRMDDAPPTSARGSSASSKRPTGGPTGRPDTGTSPTETRFVASDNPIEFKGWTLPSPLFWMARTSHGSVTNPSTLLSDLRVSNHPPRRPPSLPYWPSYKSMSADQRATYLSWLADGRRSTNVPTGYVFVFFYGLERRLVVGKDRQRIRVELRRLLDLFGENRSFRGYATNLLTFDAIRHLGEMSAADLSDVLPLDRDNHATGRDALAVHLAHYALTEQPLPAELAYHVAKRDPRSTNSVVLKRASDEARQLFAQRYASKFSTGLTLQAGARSRFKYNPAGASLERELELSGQRVSLGVEYPDPLADTDQTAPLVALLEDCIDELRSYSRELRDGTNGDMTVEKWESLPRVLQAQVPHPNEGQWLRLVHNHLESDGIVRAPVKEVVELTDVTERDRLRRQQCRTITDVAAGLGFAIEPDPYLVPQSWALDDDLALIQTKDLGSEPRPIFRVAALLTYLAIYIASADDVVTESERRVTHDTISDMLQLDANEHRRLEGLAAVLTDADQDMRGISKRVDKLFSEKQRDALGHLLIQVAIADGKLDKSEKTHLKRAHKALGMNPDEAVRRAEEQLDESDSLDDPVTIREGETQEGEAIPPKPDEDESTEGDSVDLDTQRLSDIRRETRDVAEMLGETLGDDEDELEEDKDGSSSPAVEDWRPGDPIPGASEETDSSGEYELKERTGRGSDASSGVDRSDTVDELDLTALPERYHPFVSDILARDRWPHSDLVEMAREHNLMVSAAVSSVNEWTDGQRGEFLIREEDEGYAIRTNLIDSEELS